MTQEKKQTPKEREEFIAKLKKANPEIAHEITVKKDGESYTCYLKDPEREVLEQALGIIGQTRGNPEFILAGEIVLLGCWVIGDEIIKSDKKLLVAACLQANGLIQTAETELKKI